ncbi:pectinesterase [Ricinus communis]|jgi:pectinesterase|uniref:pectinesterase n=1 Tax=Ricinus communis TaxID=3988 RepID=B9SRK1_RICCO|nr:pectinesterase [Ricinus communis]EEF33778.1 Pectinesterase-4 precursor, putative [Ricinus communis]|eukprot:XP_002528620.1 pectinesterase [Ricinus communis]
MIGKVVVSGISLILVVGVVIGVVAAVNRGGGSTSTENLSPHMKAVTQLCQPTNYKETCTQTLSGVNSTDPKELIKAGILAISSSLTKSLNLSDDLVVKAGSEPRTKLALEDCKTLLKEANEELQDTLAKMSDINLKTIADQADEFRIWLSSIISYQELCMDGFDQDNEVKSAVQKSTEFGSELTDNVLNILGGISDVLKSFGLQFNLPGSNSRRLLQADGYPTWLSGADRKLLAARNNAKLPPNAVVALDGSGKFKSINDAINSYPNGHKGRYVIYVKAGIYHEAVKVPKTHTNIYMYGDGPRKTIVTGKKSFTSGINTWNTASFVVEADGFICKSMGFQNTAGPDGHQAVAIRVNSDMSVFHNCRMDGYQDTLLYQAKRQFYRNCVISGTIDFLFGYGAAVIQNSLIIVRKPNPNQFNTVTADGRKERGQNTGLVIHNCRIVPEVKLAPQRLTTRTYLGRPWKQYSRTVVMETQLGDLIQPDGWMPWAGSQFLDTLYYAEYANSGPGANTARRVKWKTLHLLNRNEAQQFTVGRFLAGAGQWIGGAGAPFLLGFKR